MSIIPIVILLQCAPSVGINLCYDKHTFREHKYEQSMQAEGCHIYVAYRLALEEIQEQIYCLYKHHGEPISEQLKPFMPPQGTTDPCLEPLLCILFLCGIVKVQFNFFHIPL